MPNNNSMPNMQMANWIRNFVDNHQRPPIPQPQPDYTLDSSYEYNFSKRLAKSPKSTTDTLTLVATIDIIKYFTNEINVFYVDNFYNKTQITDFTFNYDNDEIEINLDSSYYNYNSLNIIVNINQTYFNVTLNQIYTCYYYKVYIPVTPLLK